ncbi:HD domain-containing protein [Kineococcus sp. LSe6-4]|uniref:HD domain-containing protein n=1 Tax=Kineococcus halophytocola TaxID=3234027 RepID=A0ABV4GZP3_9ACTN
MDGKDTGEALALARDLLTGVDRRYEHVAAAARTAERIARVVPEQDRDVLVTAATLHDIGYAPALRRTGFHPLDGADHLKGLGWPLRVVGLVAHHSGARFLARAHGVEDLLDVYPDEGGPVADALLFCDMTTAPDGRTVSFAERVRDAHGRHREAPEAARRARAEREPFLRAAVARVQARLGPAR